MHAVQQADAEGEDGGGRRRARDVRRDARQAEREVQANRMRKKDVSPVTLPLRCCLVGTSCSLQQDQPVMPYGFMHTPEQHSALPWRPPAVSVAVRLLWHSLTCMGSRRMPIESGQCPTKYALSACGFLQHKSWFCIGLTCTIAQMYEERRRAREAEREAKEEAEEEEAARKEQARLKAQDEEAAKWMGQIDLQQQGEEAQSEEQTQAMLFVQIALALHFRSNLSRCCLSDRAGQPATAG